MKTFKLVAALFLSFALTNVASAQTDDRIPVIVRATGDDIVGGRLVYKVKEEIRHSASMQLADPGDMGVELILVTLERDPDYPASATVYSAVWAFEYNDIYPAFITSQTGYCGSSRVDSQAESLVAETDKVIEELRATFEAIKSYQQGSSSN